MYPDLYYLSGDIINRGYQDSVLRGILQGFLGISAFKNIMLSKTGYFYW